MQNHFKELQSNKEQNACTFQVLVQSLLFVEIYVYKRKLKPQNNDITVDLIVVDIYLKPLTNHNRGSSDNSQMKQIFGRTLIVLGRCESRVGFFSI